MSTVTLRPNGVHDLGGSGYSLTGTTVHGAWSDNSDATYVTLDAAGDYMSVALGTSTIPTDAVTKQVTLRIRAGTTTAATSTALSVEVLTVRNGAYAYVAVSPITVAETATYTVGTIAATLTQAEIDALVFRVYATNTTAVRIYEAYVDLVFAEQPVATVTAPAESSTVGSSSPLVVWSFAQGADAVGGETAYEVVVASAAQYGAVGFDPGNYALFPATYQSGKLAGSNQSHRVSGLVNGTTYRAYVAAAQTVNGNLHWSDWDYNQFTASFTSANVSTVTVSPSNADGYIQVTVNRTGATAWQAVTVERSLDGGETWEWVRGATGVRAVNRFVTSWGANSIVVRDYEVPNGAAVIYRAHAYTNASGSEVWGPWVQSASTSWTSTEWWVKDPHDPDNNTKLAQARYLSGMRRTRRSHIHDIAGRPSPVVISSPVLSTMAGVTQFRTLTESAADAFEGLLEAAPVLLVQLPSTDRWGSRYLGGLELVEDRPVEIVARPERFWEVSFVEVDRPEDETA